MDALALLCTLYAEGPATLQRLRGNGCESLAALLELEAEALGLRMGWNERVSQRFLREARSLADRLDIDWADEEGGEDEPHAEEAVVEPQPALPRTAPMSQQHEALMARWRQLDQEAPPAGLEPEEHTPRAEPTAAEIDPRLRRLDLGADQLERLSAAGVRTLRTLVERNTFDLVQLLGIPYTRAQRLQFLAKRLELVPEHGPAGDADPDAAHPAAPTPVSLTPAQVEGGGSARHDDGQRGPTLDAAGPFA